MLTINFGIDLGTTNSSIAQYKAGEVEVFKNPLNLKQTLPSVVAFRKRRIFVGDKAKEIVEKDPLNVVGGFKRKMGTADTYFLNALKDSKTPIELSAIVLKELKNFIHTGEQLEAAVITIPAAFDTMQSNATKKAAYEAGFQELVLLQEPIAASLAYANKANVQLNDGKWLVYDLGGGTFDVALVTIEENEMKVIDHEGDNYLGGSDFDQAIVTQLIVPFMEKEGRFHNLEKEMKTASGKYNRLYYKLLYLAEEAKIVLTHAPFAEIELEVEDDSGEEVDIYMTISKEQLNEVLTPFIERTIGMIESIMQRNFLSKEDIKFLLMVGGSTYIPAIRNQLEKHFGIEINCDIDPTTAVVVGAAYFAGMKPRRVLKDKSTIKEKTKEIPQKKSFWKKSIPDAPLSIKTAYKKVTQEDETAFLASIEGDVRKKFYRISRLDGGYDSGLKALAAQITEYLPLAKGVFNQFHFKVLDKYNNPIEAEVATIGITQGKFNIHGQPLPNDICLEVDAIENNTTYLEPVFKKNNILPLKKTIIKEISKTILKGSDAKLIINVVEGEADSLPAANIPIGRIEILGQDLERDLVKGSDVELTFEMSESRDLNVEVYLSLTDQAFENVFNPSETEVHLEVLVMELEEFKRNLLNKQKEYEIEQAYEQAAMVQALMTQINDLKQRILAVDKQDVTDEKHQLALQKRNIAKKIHRLYNKSVLTKTIEEYFRKKQLVQLWLEDDKATSDDKASFDKIRQQEKKFLQEGIVSVIQMKSRQLEGISSRINRRQKTTDDEIIGAFSHYKNIQYQHQKKADQFIKEGNRALDNNNIPVLLDVVNQLHTLKENERKDDPDLFKKSGTGLK